MTGIVVPFPRKKPSCGDCVNATFGVYGTHCTLFHEDIYNEHVAEECEAFESVFSPDHPAYVAPVATGQ